jgi:hypothetical protein
MENIVYVVYTRRWQGVSRTLHAGGEAGLWAGAEAGEPASQGRTSCGARGLAPRSDDDVCNAYACLQFSSTLACGRWQIGKSRLQKLPKVGGAVLNESVAMTL